LLILPVVDAVSNTGDLTARAILKENDSRLLAFGLSFAVIARYWILHHQLFESMAGYTQPLLWLNTLWLATIVFLPFPTELLAVQGDDDTAVRVLYIGSVLVTSLVLLAIRAVAARSPAVWAESGFDRDLRAAVLMAAAVAAALLVTVVVPGVGMWAMLLLLAAGPVTALVAPEP
jgi:uncharacterized membrane protein